MTAGVRVPHVLSIAGTDPTGGAGIQADLKSIGANGGYGMAVVTALVAQNTEGVRSVHVPPVAFLTEQLDAVSDDVMIDAVKIGMLADASVIEAVAAWLDRVRPPVVVLDPVMVATSGDRLLDAEAEQALRALVSKAHLITPNVPELAVLAEQPPAATWPDVLAQARQVSSRYGVIVLAKGGHLDGAQVPDALVDASGRALDGRGGADDPRGHDGADVDRSDGRDTIEETRRHDGTGVHPGHDGIREFPGERIETTNTHGTGCSLSSAVATRYARSGLWTEAVQEAKRWLTESIRHGAALEVGRGHGPVSHFAGLWARGGPDTRPSPAQVADDWWGQVAGIRQAVDDLPFIRGLADGTLDRDAFGWYLAQDALYLRDYSRVLAEASRLAPTVTEQAFWAGGAHGALVTELALHTDWLPAGTVARPSRTTTAYLDHLLATAARGDYRVLVAAVLPCYWLYADLGERLHALATDEHPYRDWLLTYGDPAFADATTRAIEIVSTVAAGADEPTRAAMWRAYLASCEHELAFFAVPLAPDRD